MGPCGPTINRIRGSCPPSRPVLHAPDRQIQPQIRFLGGSKAPAASVSKELVQGRRNTISAKSRQIASLTDFGNLVRFYIGNPAGKCAKLLGSGGSDPATYHGFGPTVGNVRPEPDSWVCGGSCSASFEEIGFRTAKRELGHFPQDRPF